VIEELVHGASFIRKVITSSLRPCITRSSSFFEVLHDSTKSESESWGNDEDDSNNEQEVSDEGSGLENESEEQESDSEQDEESDDDNQEEDEVDQENESEDDEIKSDEDKGMDDTTNQFDDDVDTRLEEPTRTGKEIVQGEGADKTEVPATSSSRSSDLASKFLNFSDIPYTDAEIVSPLDVHVHHEVPRTQAPTLLTIPISVITESSPDPLHTQVKTLVDEHLDIRLGETREEFMKFLSESLTIRIKEQAKDQLPQILPKEVSNFAPHVIEELIKESRDEVTLAKVSSQPYSTYEAASTLTEFELKKILLNKMEKSESYLVAPGHHDCYDSLKKSYDLDKDFFFSYDVYSLKRSRKDKDTNEDPSFGSSRGLKKRKLRKDVEPTTGPKKKDSASGSSKGSKSQLKSSGKSDQRNQCSRLRTLTCHQIKKGTWVIMKMSQGKRLSLDMTSSRNLHHLKNPLTLTRILARLLRKDQLKIV
ncbi:hypothetical protein Tco_1387804, partial [Tanacetum coccineum]